MFFKTILHIFKFIATIFSKLGAKYTYTNLYKLLMKYKLISIFYKPLKLIFSNLLYFFKLISAIIAVLSLFNISLLYYNFDVMNEISNIVNQIINWVRDLINDWYPNKDEDEIPEPNELYKPKTRKDYKLVEKSIQKPNYWVLPIILIGYGAIYYFNSDMIEIINPLLDKTVINFPNRSIDVFIISTFIYKGITFSLKYIIPYDLNIFTKDDKPEDDDSNLSSDLAQYFRQPEDDFPNSEDRDYFRDIVQSTNRSVSPIDNLNERNEIENFQRSIVDEWREEQSNINSPQDNEQTPRITTTNLPNNSENRPSIGTSPFTRVRIRQLNENSIEINSEDWS